MSVHSPAKALANKAPFLPSPKFKGDRLAQIGVPQGNGRKSEGRREVRRHKDESLILTNRFVFFIGFSE